jgi:hypothetical protein
MQVAATLLATLFIAILWHMYQTHNRHTRRGRALLLDQCMDMLAGSRLTRSEAGYARLEGRYCGYKVRMSLEEDHLTMRKIPSLWLHLVVEGRQASAGTLDMLVRPQNTEFYSPSWDWDGSVTPLPGWPGHAIYRTQDAPPDMQLLDPHVRHIFSDEKAKELLLTPHAVRLTYQAKQAERGAYLLLRSASFDHSPLSPDIILPLLERAIGIRRDMEGAIA